MLRSISGFRGGENDACMQAAAARPATLEQLKAAAERHGLDLQKLIADAKEKGVEIEGA